MQGFCLQGAAYYRFLASALPTSELGQAVWRRLRREASRRVRHLLPRHDNVPKIVHDLGLTSQDDFAQRMRDSRAGRGPIEPNERADARSLIATHLPSMARECCARGDAVLSGELFLFGKWREHARGELAPGIAALDWTRDPLHGAHASNAPSEMIDRDATGTDSRATWEAARFAHVYWLAQAHTVAGLAGSEESRGAREPGIYARALVLHVRDFLATQPVGRGIHWTCPMEAALRVMHLAPALLLIRDSMELDAPFWAEAAQALVDHGRFIDEELEDAQTVPGNHLLADLAGLATLGCLFPELPGAMGWREHALPAFGEELLRQSTDEGLAFEASLPYHRFSTELGLVVQAFARRQGMTLDAPVLQRLWKMCEVVEAATLPDRKLANIGDNDSSRAFSATAIGALATAHIPSLRAALGGPGTATSIEPEALWLGGLSGLRRNVLQVSPYAPTERGPSHFQASGFAVLTASNGRGATLWAGDNGQHGLGGHAHNDKLSCEIVLGGRRFVADAGCPVYVADPAERDRYRSTARHATVEVDNLEQSPMPIGRPFLLPDAARATLLRVADHAAWGEHHGYRRVRPAVLHQRELVVPPEADAILVTDRLSGEGAHIVDVRWPFSSRLAELRRATGDEREAIERIEELPFGEGRFDTERVIALGWAEEQGPCALLAIASEQPWEAALTESCWSPGYGERVSSLTLKVRFRTQLPLAVTSAFIWLGSR